MLKLKLHYCGHMMRGSDPFEKTRMLGKIEGRRRRGRQRMRWLDGITNSMDMSLSSPGVGDEYGGLACCSSWVRKKLITTEQLNWAEHTHPECQGLQVYGGDFYWSGIMYFECYLCYSTNFHNSHIRYGFYLKLVRKLYYLTIVLSLRTFDPFLREGNVDWELPLTVWTKSWAPTVWFSIYISHNMGHTNSLTVYSGSLDHVLEFFFSPI